MRSLDMLDRTIDTLLLDFARALEEKGLMKKHVKISEIFEVADILKAKPGFKHFVHYWMCDCKMDEPGGKRSKNTDSAGLAEDVIDET